MRIYRFLSEETVPYLRARNRKPLHRQIREMMALYREYGVLPYHYVTYELYRNSHANDVLEYLPDDMLIVFCASLNPGEGIEAARDKIKFSQKMRKAGLAAIEVLFTVRSDGTIRRPDGSQIAFPEFVRVLEAQCQDAFLKQRHGLGGFGAVKLPVRDIAAMGPEKLRQRLFEARGVKPGAEFLVQPAIVQHPVLASITDQSVNTARIDTYVEGDQVHFNTAYLRVGSNAACTDNLSRGGLAIKIDIQSGKLVGNGRRCADFGKGEYTSHPDTGVRFDGTQLPYWQEVKSLVRSAAQNMLPLRSIGWDVSITPEGPVLVEANHDYDLYASQYLGGGYRNLPLGRALLQKVQLADRSADLSYMKTGTASDRI